MECLFTTWLNPCPQLELEQSIQRKREMARSITGYASNVLSTVTGDHPPSVGAGSVVDVNQMNQLIDFYLTRQQALDEETNEVRRTNKQNTQLFLFSVAGH